MSKERFSAEVKEEMDGLEQFANQIKDLPKEEQAAARAYLQNRHNEIVQKIDLPIETIAPDAWGLKLIDYMGGLGRTVVGEGAVLGKQALTGEPYDAKSAGENLYNAAMPFPIFGAQPAKPSEYYLRKLGIPKGSSVSETETGEALGITPGGIFDFSPRGAVGFGLDMLSGKTYSGGAKGVEKLRGGIKETAVSKTAAQQREMAAKYLKDIADKKTASLSPELAIEFLKGFHRFQMNPLGAVGEDIYRSRFKELDTTNRLAGKMPISDVMIKEGGAGGSTTAILKDMEAILNKKQEVIKNIVSTAHIYPVTSTEILHSLYQDPEILKGLTNPATAAYTRNAIKEVQDMFEAAIENNPNTSPGYRNPDNNITLKRVYEGLGIGPKVLTQYETANVKGVPDLIQPLELPFARGKDEMYGTPLYPVTGDPLENIVQKYNAAELFNLKQKFQQEAFDRNAYNARDITDPVSPGQRKAGAEMMARVGRGIGEKLEQRLDKPWDLPDEGTLFKGDATATPEKPVGAELAKANQDIASILEASKNIDRPEYTRPLRMDIPFDIYSAMKIPVGSALMNPITTKAIGPAARAMWLKNYWDRQYNNPYGKIRKELGR